MRLLATLALALVLTTAVHAQVTFLDEVRIEDGLRVGDHAAPTALVDIIKNTTGGLSPFAITRTNGGNQNNRFRFSITGNSGGVAPGSLYLIADQNDGDFAVVTDQSSLDPQFLVRSTGVVGQRQTGTFGSLAFGNQWVATGVAPFPFGGEATNPYGIRIQDDSDFALFQLVERASPGKETTAGNKDAEIAWGDDTDDRLNFVFVDAQNTRTQVAQFSVTSFSDRFAEDGSPASTGVFSVQGDIRSDALELRGGSDIAEPFMIADSPILAPGMVVAIDPDVPGALRVADRAYDRTVAGIVSGAGGIRPGLTLRQDGTIADGDHPVALTGRVYAYADASNGPIRPGDLLTTSATPGHAQRVTDSAQSQGAVLGKAMTSLDEGTGLVLVLVTLQ
ncbi:MAG: hypothetical protein CMM85_09045 [Rhodothermaceae bacterium]|nr:hypothetical protein [Rhodothermaceae bacterium]